VADFDVERPRDIPLWIIILSVVAGLILLMLVVILLWKVIYHIHFYCTHHCRSSSSTHQCSPLLMHIMLPVASRHHSVQTTVRLNFRFQNSPYCLKIASPSLRFLMCFGRSPLVSTIMSPPSVTLLRLLLLHAYCNCPRSKQQ